MIINGSLKGIRLEVLKNKLVGEMFREGESWCFIYFDKRQLSMLKPKKYDLSSAILYI